MAETVLEKFLKIVQANDIVYIYDNAISYSLSDRTTASTITFSEEKQIDFLLSQIFDFDNLDYFNTGIEKYPSGNIFLNFERGPTQKPFLIKKLQQEIERQQIEVDFIDAVFNFIAAVEDSNNPLINNPLTRLIINIFKGINNARIRIQKNPDELTSRTEEQDKAIDALIDVISPLDDFFTNSIPDNLSFFVTYPSLIPICIND